MIPAVCAGGIPSQVGFGLASPGPSVGAEGGQRVGMGNSEVMAPDSVKTRL